MHANEHLIPSSFGTFTTMDIDAVKEGKRLPMSNIYGAFLWFLVYLLVLLPLWLFLMLPITFASFVCSKIYSSVFRKIRSRSSGNIHSMINDLSVDTAKIDRKYDIVLYGVTGFTGTMCLEYLIKQYIDDDSIKFAIAGRSSNKMNELKKSLNINHIDIIVASSDDIPSLIHMASSTKLVLSSAGPFQLIGSELVGICAKLGTHYCDITGEEDWVRRMIDLYDDVATKSGAMIVHMCGHDCIPWDMCVLECSKLLKKKNEQLIEVDFYDEVRASASGGTYSTIMHSLDNRTRYKSLLGYDPLLKTSVGKSLNKFIAKTTKYLTYSSKEKKWVGPFVMSMVIGNCIRRSNAINNYGACLVYREALVYPNFFAGFVSMMDLIIFGTALSNPVLKYMLKYILPAPGQGPSVKDMNQGYLKTTCYGTGSNHSQVKVVFYFPTDPAYRDTARMLVESGITIIKDKNNIKSGGGVLTSATCQGDLLTKRLVATGSIMYVCNE